MPTIGQNLQRIDLEIKAITNRPVTLIAVTKHKTPEEIKDVVNAGCRDIGENRWQEASTKLDQLPPAINKHFIGHLQTNKVVLVVKHFDMIQSVDRLKLAEAIEKSCVNLAKIIPILVQVNTSHEAQKSGCNPTEAMALIEKIALLPHLKVEGLMTIALHASDEKRVRNCFKKLKELFDRVAQQKIPNVTMQHLSMGMSEDYKVALQEGATMIRIGRKLFEG